MAYFLKLNKKKWFFISQFRKEKKRKEVACIIYAMIIKTYQVKYHEVSISYLYLSNSLNLTKKTKFIF
jgi:hypothetical protein